MLRYLIRTISISLLIAIALLSFVTYNSNSQTDIILDCIPELSEVIFSAQSTDDSKQYVYMILEVPDLGRTISLVSVDLSEDSCNVLISPDNPDTIFSSVVPMSVARDLSKQRIQRVIENVGGLENYQELLDESDVTGPEKISYSPEQIWALQELGVRLPKHYDLRTEDPEINSVLATFRRSDETIARNFNNVRIFEGYAISDWFVDDESGKFIAQRENEQWVFLGSTDIDIDSEQLSFEFIIPFNIAKQLLGEEE